MTQHPDATNDVEIAPDPMAQDATDPHRGPYQLLPPLSSEELAQLESSIRTRGVEDPISVDEEGRTLDGHHRRAIAERLGISYETKIVEGLSEDEKRLYAIRRNTERRQLTKAQRALVGLRAEPLFRTEAKARQGVRTDISPDLAKRRRVWAAEEAARLVGLPLSTYKSYRDLITAARRARGAGEVESGIESGHWDMPQVRVVATERRREEVEDDAKQAWEKHGLLGRPDERHGLRIVGGTDEAGSRESLEDDGFWRCDGCEAYWSPLLAACERCGTARPVVTAPPILKVVDTINAGSPTQESKPETVAPLPRDVRPVRRLALQDTMWLDGFRRSRLRWHTGGDARAVAEIVAESWDPKRVADLRDGIWLLTGWLAALDAALGAARLGDSLPQDATDHPSDEQLV